MMLDKVQREGDTSSEPAWIQACLDERSRLALAYWMDARRGLWQDWGRMAQTEGRAALAGHLLELMEQELPGEYVATAVNRLDDDRELEIGMVLATRDGVRTQRLYVHTFRNGTQRRRFLGWLFDRGDSGVKLEELVDVAINRGRLPVAEMIEAIAARGSGRHAARSAA